MDLAVGTRVAGLVVGFDRDYGTYAEQLVVPAAASGELPARVHTVVPLAQVADAHRAVAKGGVRGRYVLQP